MKETRTASLDELRESLVKLSKPGSPDDIQEIGELLGKLYIALDSDEGLCIEEAQRLRQVLGTLKETGFVEDNVAKKYIDRLDEQDEIRRVVESVEPHISSTQKHTIIDWWRRIFNNATISSGTETNGAPKEKPKSPTETTCQKPLGERIREELEEKRRLKMVEDAKRIRKKQEDQKRFEAMLVRSKQYHKEAGLPKLLEEFTKTISGIWRHSNKPYFDWWIKDFDYIDGEIYDMIYMGEFYPKWAAHEQQKYIMIETTPQGDIIFSSHAMDFYGRNTEKIRMKDWKANPQLLEKALEKAYRHPLCWWADRFMAHR